MSEAPRAEAPDPRESVHFLVHDGAGRIHRAGICARGDLGIQLGSGEEALTVREVDRRYHPDFHLVQDGRIVKQAERLPPRLLGA